MTKNLAASIHSQLMNRARAEGRSFNDLLQYFTLERFLYRLGRSPEADRFILKGARMFSAWRGILTRPTRDIDLAGQAGNSVDRIVEIVMSICRQVVDVDDGLRFLPDSVRGEEIVDEAEYHGVRVRLVTMLGRARIPLQIDIGFGDPIVPKPVRVQLPTLLDFPPPRLRGYTRESVIAEKFQAMTALGETNSRMKDFYDIWLLATHFEFDGAVLADAIRETFQVRLTEIQPSPVAFSDEFANAPAQQQQWNAFRSRHQLSDAPQSLSEAIAVLRLFLEPVALALLTHKRSESFWPAGGPWTGFTHFGEGPGR